MGRSLSRRAAAAAVLVLVVAAGLAAVLGLTSAAPSASFSPSTAAPAANSLVLFADTSGGAPTSWTWDFGDGTGSTDRNPAHAWRREGAYVVRLTASNASGSSSVTAPITVTAAGVLRLIGAHPFDLTLSARDPRTGNTGTGVVLGQNDVYGYFSLPTLSGNAGNPEVIVKMVDASGIGQNYWVFYGTMTDLEFTLSVRETSTGIVKTYSRDLSGDPSKDSGQFDTSGFVATPTPPNVTEVRIDTKAWEFSPGGANAPPLVLSVGNSYRLRFHNVDPAGVTNPDHGFTGISDLGISGSPGATISPGHDYVTEVFTPQPFQRGTYPFQCTNNNCGGDPQQHASMTGILVVQ
ncbi:MAG: PKD domain-containing protein [Acidobacteriota bacterium]|nr:PKD domain-containing protein [Acidobacteriota bacterium]